MLGDKDEFLATHSIDETDFIRSGLDWSDLQKLHADFEPRVPGLLPVAEFVAKEALSATHAHAATSRVKDPERLVAKIIRRCCKKEDPFITSTNYRETVSDLIGVRILHKFKRDWPDIHDHLTQRWNPKEPPVAYYQYGDPSYLLEMYKKSRCEIEEHPNSYRSVHYLVDAQMGNDSYQVEIQVRTLFEEAWAECDHAIRYPKLADNYTLSQYMSNVNLYAGLADEMSGYARVFADMTALEKQPPSDDRDRKLLETIDLYQTIGDVVENLYYERLRNVWCPLDRK
jgi:ppGpp synthetase/RelA/SpoT-type nucleotidyltranferase